MTSTENREIKIKTELKKDVYDEDYVFITVWVPGELLRSESFGTKYVKHDTGVFQDKKERLVGGKLDDHDCTDGDDGCGVTCYVSGLYTLIDPEINKPFWFVLVNMSKLTLETGEIQGFTLVLD